MMKTRVSIINYSNTIPFAYGLLHSEPLREIADFSYGYPAQVAQMLCNDMVDMSIISVGAMLSTPNAHIVSKYCISATKKVDSVILGCSKPLDQVDTIMLDYQSRTSNVLVKILAKYAWNISPKFVMGYEGYELEHSDSAKVIIGDRALQYASQFQYVYDLAFEWNKAFGLPFVFAAWVANKTLPSGFMPIFEDACEYGVNHIEEAIEHTNEKFSFDIHSYLHQSVEFELNDEKRAAMELFFEKANALHLV